MKALKITKKGMHIERGKRTFSKREKNVRRMKKVI